MIKVSLSSFALVFSFFTFFIYNLLFFCNIDFSHATLYKNMVLSVVFVANNLLNSFLIFCYLYFFAKTKRSFIIFFPILLFWVIAILALNITTNFQTTSFLIYDIIDNLSNTSFSNIGIIGLYKKEIINGFIWYFVVLCISLWIIDFKTRKKIKIKKFFLWLIFIYLISYLLFYVTVTFVNPDKKNIIRKVTLREQYRNYSQNSFTFPIFLNFKPKSNGLNKARKNFLQQNVIHRYKNLYNEANFYNKDQSPRLLIVNLGESVNSSHFGLNGYKRKTNKYFSQANTTPNLEKIKSQIVSFKKNKACSTLTSIEWPCMFFPYTRQDFNNFKDILFLEDNLPDIFTILHKQGYEVFLVHFGSLWEQSIRKIRSRIQLQNPKYGDTDLYYVCNQTKGYQQIDCQLTNVIKFIKAHKNKKVAIFTYGAGGSSHYPYYYYPRYIKKKHEDRIKHNINKYDGTILALDSYLYKLINYLEKSEKNSMMLYISDHGEAVDQGMQHGQNYVLAKTKYKDVLNPATIVWFSQSWLSNIDKKALKNVRYYRNNTYNHSQIFEGVLKCAGIENKNYIYKRNICN